MNSREHSSEANHPWTEADWERFIREQEPAASRRAAESDGDTAAARELGFSTPPKVGGSLGDEPGAGIRSIAAFRLASELVHSLTRLREAGRPVSLDERWEELTTAAHRTVEQIASGHGIGYEDDHICGNIVQCRRGLRHLEQGLRILQRMRASRNDLELDQLYGSAVFARAALQERITALRTRVWWDDRAAS
ncbi:MAG: hypothetical protein HUU35_13475 [Armatimonadetes bacterium]|nr:hypothetical protein [Armatimonadota bacterium]